MKKIRYVLLNPTGNLTGLVLDPVSPEDRPRITEALMKGCEQVGYLQPAGQSGAAVRLQMMGGEFCGNASMAAAAWLAQEGDSADQGERNLLLEVSGAEGTVSCRVRREKEGWRGTVEMPLPREIRSVSLHGRKLQAVFFSGMVHLRSGRRRRCFCARRGRPSGSRPRGCFSGGRIRRRRKGPAQRRTDCPAMPAAARRSSGER